MDLIESLLGAKNNCGLTPLIMLVYNENPGNMKALREICLWIISQMGSDFFLSIATSPTKCGWNLFDFVARYKDDVEFFIELFKSLMVECGENCVKNIIQKPDERCKNWTILHYIFRYNSNEENVKKLLQWILDNVDIKFFAKSMILMRQTAPIALICKNSQLCITDLLEWFERQINVKFALDLIYIFLEKNKRSVLHILLESNRSLEEIKKFLDWIQPRSPMMLRSLLIHRNEKGKTTLDIAKGKSGDLESLITKFMTDDALTAVVKIEKVEEY
jgi:hypothetical protein